MKAPWTSVVAFLCLVGWGSLLPVKTAGAAAPRQTQAGQAGSLGSFLEGVPELKNRIIWVAGDGKRQSFDDWTPVMKGRIEEFYRRLLAKSPDLGMYLPSPDTIDSHSGCAFFTAEQAFDVYAAHVAHVIYVEAQHLVPWSIQSDPTVELDELLGSSSYFARIARSSGGNQYPAGIQANRDFAETPENNGLGELNGDPRIGYDLLSGKRSATHKSLIGETQLQTLVHLTAWLRDNVGHGPMDGSARELVKKYRWLDERLRPLPGENVALALDGCHSASKLMVDLARSVNIPLLHTRAYDNQTTPGNGSFFNVTHGGLVYGWGGPRQPRIIWHTDELYATQGKVCFPIDPRSGVLLTQEQADQAYFDEHWVTPQTLAKAGFVYHLERVIPGRGYGQPSRGEYEDRTDYGMMCGYWKKQGTSDLPELFLLSHDYALCGDPLLQLACRRGSINAQLTSNINAYKGDFADNDLPLLRPVIDYVERADAALKTLGGPEKFQLLSKEAKANQGKNLLLGR